MLSALTKWKNKVRQIRAPMMLTSPFPTCTNCLVTTLAYKNSLDIIQTLAYKNSRFVNVHLLNVNAKLC